MQLSDLISVKNTKNQNVTVEYFKYDSSIEKATIVTNSDLGQSLSVSAVKDVAFNLEGDALTTVDLKVEAKDGDSTVELILSKEAVKNLLLITNKMYSHLTK